MGLTYEKRVKWWRNGIEFDLFEGYRVEGGNTWKYNIEGYRVRVLASWQMRSQLYDNVNISYT